MSFSQYAGVAIVPTLSRLVLAAVFIPAGYNKVFTNAEFDQGKAQRLKNLGVEPDPAPAAAPPAGAQAWRVAESWVIVPAARTSFTPVQDPAPPTTPPSDPEQDPQDDPVTPPDQPTAPDPDPMDPTVPLPAPGRVTPPAAQADQPAREESATPAQPPRTSGATLPPGTYTARALHQVTLTVEERGWSNPVMMGWLAALTELVGGSLILLGLFSRLWGLGLAGIMVGAFYLTSLPALNTHGFALTSMPPMEFSSLILQLALFVLAFGIVLTGAGPLSLDRLLFGGPRRDAVVVVEEE